MFAFRKEQDRVLADANDRSTREKMERLEIENRALDTKLYMVRQGLDTKDIFDKDGKVDEHSPSDDDNTTTGSNISKILPEMNRRRQEETRTRTLGKLCNNRIP